MKSHPISSHVPWGMLAHGGEPLTPLLAVADAIWAAIVRDLPQDPREPDELEALARELGWESLVEAAGGIDAMAEPSALIRLAATAPGGTAAIRLAIRAVFGCEPCVRLVPREHSRDGDVLPAVLELELPIPFEAARLECVLAAVVPARLRFRIRSRGSNHG